MVGATLFRFQEDAITDIFDIFNKPNSKQTLLINSPTGSGKTIILINFIDLYLNTINNNTAFIWLCPGKGDLEEQSKNKMDKFIPYRNTQKLDDALLNGFDAGTTTFINWEKITKKGNKAISDGEQRNLFQRIAEAHQQNIDFIIIIDEEHSNNTAKAQYIIDAIAAKRILRVSATTAKNPKFDYYEIEEDKVINAGLIAKAISVNEGVESGVNIENDYSTLLDYADAKRKIIFEEYKKIGKNIRPLVLIQFPNGDPRSIEVVEEKLAEMGYTHQNGMVRKWMSGDKKDFPDNFTDNDAEPVFLLMKQAISTGWDCPRAKILVKLREGMSEQFEIQTIGRIRRMPEAMHYDNSILDLCYVYTFDDTWKKGLLKSFDKAYETRRLFLKDNCKTFTLTKEFKNNDVNLINEKAVLIKTYNHFVAKYHLDKNRDDNKDKLKQSGYIFGTSLQTNILQGTFVHQKDASTSESYIQGLREVDTQRNSIDYLHSRDEVKKIISTSNIIAGKLLERLFRKAKLPDRYKLINMDIKEYYAFVINNIERIKDEFKEVISDRAGVQLSSDVYEPKADIFRIPEKEFYRYDVNVKKEIEYLSNAYEKYTSAMNSTLIRSLSEQMFEKYCENDNTIDWVYKNGDSGIQYMSIVYLDGLLKQRLFYPDYIVKKKDGSIWIIETKGGQSSDGIDQNIDAQILNKFDAFKKYAEKYHINWGFVRNYNGELYLNNTKYVSDINDESWVELNKML